MAGALRGVLVAALVAGALGAPAARAESRAYSKPICLDDALLIPKLVAELAIPVGCELRDCCPGCPAPEGLDWRVRVSGPALAAATLSFPDLPPLDLKAEGNARPAAEGGVVVARGEGLVRGLPVQVGGRVPMASLDLALDRPALARLAAGAAEPGERGVLEVSVEQLLGSTVVNEFQLRYQLKACVVPEPCDHVKLQDNRGGDRAVVLLDAWRAGGFSDDEVRRGEVLVPVGDVRAPGASPPSEVSVFSDGDAMAMHAPEPSWKDTCGDEVTVALEPLLQVPLHVWVARSEILGFTLPPPVAQAEADVLNANLVYDRNKTGLSFAAQIDVVDADLEEAALAALACSGAVDVPSEVFDPKHINVYYLPIPFTGASCDTNRDVIFIGSMANVATLAHELGHALSLFGDEATWGHTNQVPGFDEQNVMWAEGPPTRDLFSLGQAFRLNAAADSWINVQGVRSGPTHPCTPKSDDAGCPPLALDWIRP